MSWKVDGFRAGSEVGIYIVLRIILAADVASSITQQSPNRKLKPASRDSEINTVLNTDSIY